MLIEVRCAGHGCRGTVVVRDDDPLGRMLCDQCRFGNLDRSAARGTTVIHESESKNPGKKS